MSTLGSKELPQGIHAHPSPLNPDPNKVGIPHLRHPDERYEFLQPRDQKFKSVPQNTVVIILINRSAQVETWVGATQEKLLVAYKNEMCRNMNRVTRFVLAWVTNHFAKSEVKEALSDLIQEHYLIEQDGVYYPTQALINHLISGRDPNAVGGTRRDLSPRSLLSE